MKRGRRLRAAVFSVFLAAALIGAGGLLLYWIDAINAKTSTQKAREIYLLPSSDQAENEPDEAARAFEAIRRLNPEAVAWIRIPDTQIDYPVAMSDDNRYYLSHNFLGERSYRGAIFMDWRNDPRDKHLIIYGHAMRDKSMFGALEKFKSEAFAAAHPVLEMNLAGKATRWRVFAVRITDSRLLDIAFANDDLFAQYAASFCTQSLINTGICVDASDTVLTLSTCEGSRHLLVHLKRID
jgi:sortase B